MLHAPSYGWIGLAAFLALGWAATAPPGGAAAVLWLRKQFHSGQPSSRERLNALRQAWRVRDPKSARAALFRWGKAQWSDNPPHHLDEVARRAGGPLAQKIAAWIRVCFSPEAQAWDGSALLRALEGVGKTDAPSTDNGLEPLYKT